MLTLLSLFGACAPAPDTTTELTDAFVEASETYDVPYAVLVGVSYEGSHFNHRDGAENLERGVGVMNLHADGTYPSLAEAADLIGEDADDVSNDPRLNILAAAALLNQQARQSQVLTGNAIDSTPEWYPLVAAFSGAQDPLVADNFADRVYRSLSLGFAGVSPQGEIVSVDPLADAYHEGSDLSGSAVANEWVPASSSNYTNSSRGAGDITTVVIHTTEGSYSGTISWFQNSSAEVSAHYVVRSSDGQITQMVDEEDIAWHAGDWDTNQHSIGIEHEGYVDDPSYYTDAMYRASASLTSDICDRYGIPKDRAHIIGHYEVPGCSSGDGGGSGCHTDPGDGWDWDYYMSLVTGTGSGSTSMGGSGVSEGTRTGSFSASVTANTYGVTDTCSGPISGSISGSSFYATGTCTLVNHPDKSGNMPVTWSGQISGTTVSGKLLVDGHSADWSGTLNSDGTINFAKSGQEDLGGDVGTLSYSFSVNVNAS